MVTKEIKINDEVIGLELIADEGKLLYLTYEIEELGNQADGVFNLSVPVSFDLNNVVEK
jgi:hypothetical protein